LKTVKKEGKKEEYFAELRHLSRGEGLLLGGGSDKTSLERLNLQGKLLHLASLASRESLGLAQLELEGSPLVIGSVALGNGTLQGLG
jgi:hypothetical protein